MKKNTPTMAIKWDTNIFPKKLCSERNLLVTIQPPEISKKKALDRKPLNLCFCIDVSGSMGQPAQKNPEFNSVSNSGLRGLFGPGSSNPWGGQINIGNVYESRLDRVKKAFSNAISLLDERDTVSIVVFDTNVRTIFHPSKVTSSSRNNMLNMVNGLVPGSSTALYPGWHEAATHVAKSAFKGSVNRILLLTDGEANHGEQNLDVICSNFAKLAREGIETSCFGVGDSFNEDLLEKGATSGMGNYYFIGGNVDLVSLFASEIGAAGNVLGRMVEVQVKGLDGTEWRNLNDFSHNGNTFFAPTLMFGQKLDLVFNVKIPKNFAGISDAEIVLTWKTLDGEKREIVGTVPALIAATKKEVEASPLLDEVTEIVAFLKAAEEKRNAAKALDRGDMEMFRSSLNNAMAFSAAAPAGALSARSLSETETLLKMSETGESNAVLRKTALYQSYNSTRGKEN